MCRFFTCKPYDSENKNKELLAIFNYFYYYVIIQIVKNYDTAMNASNAASIIYCHPHPSGDPTPSQEDIEVTKRLVEVGLIIGVEMLDHIVLGDNCYVSMKEKGYIENV